jgi:hypothetical protein
MTNPSCKQAINKRNYGCVMYILCSLSKSNSQFVTSSVIRPHGFHRPHFFFFSFPFFFSFNSYTTVAVCHWVAEKSWKARNTCAQEKVFHERKTRCFLPLSFVQINSIQPLLYVLSAIIVPLLFIYILIFLAFLLQYGDYLYASHFHFVVVVIWVCLKSCFPSVRPGINEFGVLVGLFKT